MNCVYCGISEATTEDHVVAEGFFPVAPPEGYIKVPACEPCNNGFSRDEEYFITAILGEGTFGSAAALAVVERLKESHRTGRRSRIGLGVRLRDAVERVDVMSSTGLFLGTAPAIRLEIERANRVLEKIVRGLFFHEFGGRLDDDVKVWVELKPDPAMLDRPPLAWVRTDHAGPAKCLDDVFCYRVCVVKDAPDFTAWLLTFYDSVLAAACTFRMPNSPGTGTDLWLP